ncbi:hypothetical protein [Burkholderia phage FLC8]|nr:hypothetical protein [Burkholderia phage FLC8]
MFFHDMDNEEVYPHNGTLEEKAVHSLEQMRTRFWWEKKNYLQQREGGPRHTATLLAFGPNSARAMANHAEVGFKNFLSQAYLTEDGETTDPKYPTDKMINTELRRIRSVIILNVSQYMEQFDTMMPDSLADWTKDLVYFNLYPYTTKYVSEAYDQINFVIPQKKLQAKSPAELEKQINELAIYFGNQDNLRGYGWDFVVHSIRDRLIEFLLNGLPFSNDRLKKKDELVAKPAEEGEAKPVLH